MSRIDVDAVRALITGEKILEFYSQKARGTRELQLRECPRCKRQQRRGAVRVNRATGKWIHHGGPGGAAACKGDAFALIAAFEGLDVRNQFPDVLSRAASIVGVGPDIDHAELARMRAEHMARSAVRERRSAEERARAEALVPTLWDSLDRRHTRGERYLGERGLDPEALRNRGDIVRFRRDGSPAVRLHSLDTGATINIITRQIEREPKVLALDIARVLGSDDVIGSLSTLGSIIGWPGEIALNGTAVLTEGVTDSLAAVLAFEGCTVLGANGARRMPNVARAAAPVIARARGWLLVAADNDQVGQESAADAMVAAMDAGLVLRESVRVVEVDPHKDLAAAWQAGWQWRRPTSGACGDAR